MKNEKEVYIKNIEELVAFLTYQVTDEVPHELERIKKEKPDDFERQIMKCHVMAAYALALIEMCTPPEERKQNRESSHKA